MVNYGSPMLSAAATERKTINELCPVTGSAVDLSKTVVYEGRRIGFCCDKCLAAFNANPKTYLAKLPATAVQPIPGQPAAGAK